MYLNISLFINNSNYYFIPPNTLALRSALHQPSTLIIYVAKAYRTRPISLLSYKALIYYCRLTISDYRISIFSINTRKVIIGDWSDWTNINSLNYKRDHIKRFTS